MALQALTGNHGRLGAGVFAKPGHAFPKATDRLQRPDLVPEGTRTINIVDVSRLLLDETLDPPLRAVFIYNHNPVATHPDQNRMRRALAREDVFAAGADVVMTDSMSHCDVVLPCGRYRRLRPARQRRRLRGRLLLSWTARYSRRGTNPPRECRTESLSGTHERCPESANDRDRPPAAAGPAVHRPRNVP